MRPCRVCKVDARYRHKSRLCSEGVTLWEAYSQAVDAMTSYCMEEPDGALYPSLRQTVNEKHRAYRAHVEGS